MFYFLEVKQNSSEDDSFFPVSIGNRWDPSDKTASKNSVLLKSYTCFKKKKFSFSLKIKDIYTQVFSLFLLYFP